MRFSFPPVEWRPLFFRLIEDAGDVPTGTAKWFVFGAGAFFLLLFSGCVPTEGSRGKSRDSNPLREMTGILALPFG